VHSVAAKILPRVAARFIGRRSDVQIVLQDDNSSHVWRRVKSNNADMGFSSVMIDDSELAFEPLFRDQCGVLAGENHPLFDGRTAVRWADLRPFEYVRLSGDAATSLISQMDGLPENIANPRYVATYNTLLWAMLRDSERISIVPALFTPDRAASGLAFLPLVEPVEWRNVFTVTPKRLRSSEVIEDVIALVKEVVAEIAGENVAVEAQ
jgi:DNA-binding transcriptional LysR family regulator